VTTPVGSFRPLRIALLTVSDTRTLETDGSGDVLRERLEAAGHVLYERDLVPDDRYRLRAVVSAWIADPAVEVVLVTGGTGITGRDVTPEALLPLLDKTLPGFGELFRALSLAEVGTAALHARPFAGSANGTLVFGLPGSPGACRTAWDRILAEQLDARTRPCNVVELLPRIGAG
jgi:molybdopterin adenylyltransferase